MPTADSYYGYLSIVNPDYYWSGKFLLVSFNLMRYRPIQVVRQINIPVLFIAAQKIHLFLLSQAVKLRQILRLL